MHGFMQGFPTSGMHGAGLLAIWALWIRRLPARFKPVLTYLSNHTPQHLPSSTSILGFLASISTWGAQPKASEVPYSIPVLASTFLCQITTARTGANALTKDS